jgi:hypothetical protein
MIELAMKERLNGYFLFENNTPTYKRLYLLKDCRNEQHHAADWSLLNEPHCKLKLLTEMVPMFGCSRKIMATGILMVYTLLIIPSEC